ncbi:hypothetical protein KSP40_PGU022484 [Platanthera guangdongensis]|uniref:Uncharacterized protein n=1 Tax=Platanthera guangdongensis TaxID=2320717 RepID=A0ABR2M0U0_9ASPA
MEGKRLDLDAPLISFRRITTAPLRPEDAALQSLKDCGAVPFFWEKTPGQPKDNPSNESFCGGGAAIEREPLKPLLGRILKGNRGELMKIYSSEKSLANRGNGGTSFSDLRDSLSCNESFSTKNRLSSLCADHSFRDSSSNFSKDPTTEEFMMGLFLPAAEAVASELRRQSWKKPPRAAPEFAGNYGTQDLSRRWVNVASPRDNGRNEKEEEEEEDDESVSYEEKEKFSSKTCGLFPKFCLKNSFCFLNHVLGMKFPDLALTRPCLKPSPGMKILHHERVSKDLSVNGDYIEEDSGIDLNSISKQLTYWSNSQPLDGSSCPHSSGTVLSPNKNDDLKTKSRSSKTGDLDSSEEDSESYWDFASSNCWLQGSGSTSPATYRTLCVQPSQMADTSGSNSSTVFHFAPED